MYCSQCGKKVAENMLFCPFCGSPIVIPDQDPIQRSDMKHAEVPPKEPEAGSLPPMPPIRLFDEADEAEEEDSEFVPLSVQELEKGGSAGKVPEEKPSQPLPAKREKPVQLQGRKPDLTDVRPPKPEKQGAHRPPQTLVPQREFDPNDMFMDGVEDEEEDWEDEDYSYEEPEEGGFFTRHIRGVVSLALFVVVLAVVTGWVFSAAGQRALARADLAWSPSVYATMGYEAHQAGNYAQAGGRYEQALARDKDNYSYANSAAVCYYMAQDSRWAEKMARQAIAIDPNQADAYEILVRLYPDASSRTGDIAALIQQGYQRTGSESLK